MKPKKTHTHFHKGKRVFVKTRAGKSFVKRFCEQKGKWIYFLDGSRIKIKALASVTIYKAQGEG